MTEDSFEPVLRQSQIQSPFSSLSVNGPVRVKVTCGSPYDGLILSGDSELFPSVETAVVNRVMRVGLTQGAVVDCHQEVTLSLCMSRLECISLFSAAQAEIKDAEGPDMNIELANAASLRISGQAGRISVVASGASVFHSLGLTTEVAHLEAANASSVLLRVSRELQAKATSGALIQYCGSPSTVLVSSSSAGVVERLAAGFLI